jgi:hypothetical protein
MELFRRHTHEFDPGTAIQTETIRRSNELSHLTVTRQSLNLSGVRSRLGAMAQASWKTPAEGPNTKFSGLAGADLNP